jgi:hypothetical protein
LALLSSFSSSFSLALSLAIALLFFSSLPNNNLSFLTTFILNLIVLPVPLTERLIRSHYLPASALVR